MENIETSEVKKSEIRKEALALPEQVKSLGTKIEDEITLGRFNNAKLYIRKIRQRIREVFEPMRQTSYAAYQEVLKQWKEIEAPAIQAEKYCDDCLKAYMVEQKRIKDEAERKRAEEERKKKEEEERKLQEALKAEEKGDTEKAEQILNETAEEEKNAKTEIDVPKKPELSGLRTWDDYDFEITDEAKIPRMYMIPNESLIRKVVKTSKGKVEIPGIKIIVKPVIATKSR